MITEKGFTLVEIMVVFAIFFIGSAAGIAAYKKYADAKELDSAVADIVVQLNTSRANAVSQYFPPQCVQLLTNYRVQAFRAAGKYWTQVRCDDGGGLNYFTLKTFYLPRGVIFTAANPAIVTFIFSTGSGNVSGGPLRVNSKKTGVTKSISIDVAGNVTVN